MSEARQWAERSRTTRPTLHIVGEHSMGEPGLRVRVLEDTSCEIVLTHGSTSHDLVVPHDLAAVLGAFLVRFFSEPSELLHGRPHDAKMVEDHE